VGMKTFAASPTKPVPGGSVSRISIVRLAMSPTGTIARTTAVRALALDLDGHGHSLAQIVGRFRSVSGRSLRSSLCRQGGRSACRPSRIRQVDQPRNDAAGKWSADVAVIELVLALVDSGLGLCQRGGVHVPSRLSLITRAFCDCVSAPGGCSASAPGCDRNEAAHLAAQRSPCRMQAACPPDCCPRAPRYHPWARPFQPRRPRRCGPRLGCQLGVIARDDCAGHHGLRRHRHHPCGSDTDRGRIRALLRQRLRR